MQDQNVLSLYVSISLSISMLQETLLGPEELMEVLSVLWDRFEEVCLKHNVQRSSLHLTPCTLHPIPYTRHPAPCTLHP